MQVRIHLPCPYRPPILTHTPQKYATALAQGNIIDQDTIHLLFPNLNKILNFQRKFLILFEQIAELDWIDQHWGRPFIECVSTYHSLLTALTLIPFPVDRRKNLLYTSPTVQTTTLPLNS